MEKKIKLNIVVPCFNEQEVISESHKRFTNIDRKSVV